MSDIQSLPKHEPKGPLGIISYFVEDNRRFACYHPIYENQLPFRETLRGLFPNNSEERVESFHVFLLKAMECSFNAIKNDQRKQPSPAQNLRRNVIKIENALELILSMSSFRSVEEFETEEEWIVSKEKNEAFESIYETLIRNDLGEGFNPEHYDYGHYDELKHYLRRFLDAARQVKSTTKLPGRTKNQSSYKVYVSRLAALTGWGLSHFMNEEPKKYRDGLYGLLMKEVLTHMGQSTSDIMPVMVEGINILQNKEWGFLNEEQCFVILKEKYTIG